MLDDERYEEWEEGWSEEYDIEVLDSEDNYLNLEIQFECTAPIWSVLDTVSEFFETRGLKTAEIVSMTTEPYDDDYLLLRVIYTV